MHLEIIGMPLRIQLVISDSAKCQIPCYQRQRVLWNAMFYYRRPLHIGRVCVPAFFLALLRNGSPRWKIKRPNQNLKRLNGLVNGRITKRLSGLDNDCISRFLEKRSRLTNCARALKCGHCLGHHIADLDNRGRGGLLIRLGNRKDVPFGQATKPKNKCIQLHIQN
jgi:hypothetical protein